MRPTTLMPSRPIRPFRDVLSSLLARSDDAEGEWAERFNLSQGHLSNLLAGRRRPPRHGLERMIETFMEYEVPISDDEIEEFYLSAYLELSPGWMTAHLGKLHAKINVLQAQIDTLSRKVADITTNYDPKNHRDQP